MPKNIDKINKNALLFIFSAVLIIMSMIYSLTTNTSFEEIYYHDKLMDINSAKENLLMTRMIEKNDMTVIKSDSGSLFAVQEKIDNKDLADVADKIQELYTVTTDNNANFLYITAPQKADYVKDAPCNAPPNFSTVNLDNFTNMLNKREIPNLNLEKSFENRNLDEIFFITDHHWKAQTGFEANGIICKTLKEKYGFEYNEEFCKSDNFKTTKYPDNFLGSYGRQVGKYFTWSGAEDMEIITPKFETSFTQTQPFKKEKKEGNFEDTILCMEHLENKDYYNENSYSVYCGGDFRLQILENHMSENSDKILIIRDSFSQVVIPFLALNAREVHIVDVRNGEEYIGNKINVYEYIQKIQPDYVLVLYTGVYSFENSKGRYNF